ncbi:MAG: hypothetical protein EPN41_07050 [Candidimonas sp.]|nr:MAG: hypothetical protein EPN41_07050 [Candidimonas sp.]
MKNVFLAAVLMAAAFPVAAQVGVSISVGEPGFYGQIDIGGAPPPQLVYPQPVIIAPAPQYVGVPPIYLRVPPGYARHWRDHCAQYRACGRPVYFVRNDWYENHYVPYYRGRHGSPHYENRGRGHEEHADRRGEHHGDHGNHGGHGDHDRDWHGR